MSSLLLSGGKVASSLGQVEADVLIEDGRIVRVEPRLAGSADEVVDVSGLVVMPGGIDTQVHFREPGAEHKEDLATGSLGAVFGGITTTFEMPNTNPTTTTREALEDKLARAEGRSWTNYAFFVGASAENVGALAELENAPGTPGIKIFMGSSTGTLLVPDDETLREVLRHGRRPCPVHAEDHFRLEARKSLLDPARGAGQHPFLRDEEAARLATERLIALCAETGRPVHVLHVSTLQELPMLRNAKASGLPVTCEVTPQHLTLSAPDAYDRLGTLAQMNPPIRTEEHRLALWQAVSEGLFDVFGSDHAPHTLPEKAKPYPQSPSGLTGVQTMLPLLVDHAAQGRLTLETIVRMLCERPTSLYGIANKGRIAPGYDADLAVVDPLARWTVERSWIRSKSGWSPFEGMTLTGRVVHTMVGGRFAVRDGELTGQASGRMVEFDWKP